MRACVWTDPGMDGEMGFEVVATGEGSGAGWVGAGVEFRLRGGGGGFW